MKVIFLLIKGTRKDGANSAMLDLAEVLHNSGHSVSIYVEPVNYVKLIKRHIKPNSEVPNVNLPVSKFRQIPSKIIQTQSRLKPLKKLSSKIKKGFKSLLYEDVTRFKNDFRNADIIINVDALQHENIEILKKYTGAKMLFFHPFEPQHEMINKLHQYKHLFKVFSRQELYNRMCNSYDGLLFEVEEHKNSCLDLTDLEDKQIFVLNPASQETNIRKVAGKVKSKADLKLHLIVCGTIQERKAQIKAVEAFSMVINKLGSSNDIYMHIIGRVFEKKYYNQLLGTINEKGIKDKVLIHGNIEIIECLEKMHDSDILVHPAESEGMANVLREAMLLKLPIVTFDIPGTRELLRKDIDAILCKPGNTDDLADGIISIINNPDLGERLAESAYQRYEDKFSNVHFRKRAEKMLNHFTSLENRT